MSQPDEPDHGRVGDEPDTWTNQMNRTMAVQEMNLAGLTRWTYEMNVYEMNLAKNAQNN